MSFARCLVEAPSSPRRWLDFSTVSPTQSVSARFAVPAGATSSVSTKPSKVSAGVEALETVRHLGKNTLPAFSHFEKHFCWAKGAEPERPDELYGFNFQTLSRVTGPGYFVAVEDAERDEVIVDYRRVPDTRPDSWPVIQPNERGLSRFVYGFMVDTLRRVSEHVSIGSAARKGRDMGSWFLLTREADS